MAKQKRTRNFGDVIRAKLAANPELAVAVEEESFNSDIAQQVYDLRTEAKLTQKELAELVGTQQSVISRIEDADYDGHSLTMLKRIAFALKRRLRVDFCAQPALCDAEVTEFAMDWSIQDQWQTTINAAMQVAIPEKPMAVDLSGLQIPVSLPERFGFSLPGVPVTSLIKLKSRPFLVEINVKKSTKKKPARQADNQASGKLQLLAIRLVESNSKLGELKKGQLPGRAMQYINNSVMTNDAEKSAAVNVRIKLDVSYDGDQTKNPVISIMASFVAIYSMIEEFSDKDALQKVSERIGMLSIWPYWREFAQSMTTRMGLPAFPVPLINVAELQALGNQTKD